MAEPTYSKEFLSGSSAGRQILVATIATPGTLIHTAVSGSVNKDEIYVYATNNHTAALGLVVEFGGVLVPNDLIQMTIPAKTGLFLIIPGFVLNNGLIVRAYAESANLISLSGWVNRIIA